MTWVAGEDATNGAYSLHERTAPPGARSTPHIHHQLAESFYVVEGAFTFIVAGETIEATAGTFVTARPGDEHSWRVTGDAVARALVIFAPSVKRAYFEELDAIIRQSDGQPNPKSLLELAERYGWT